MTLQALGEGGLQLRHGVEPTVFRTITDPRGGVDPLLIDPHGMIPSFYLSGCDGSAPLSLINSIGLFSHNGWFGWWLGNHAGVFDYHAPLSLHLNGDGKAEYEPV